MFMPCSLPSLNLEKKGKSNFSKKLESDRSKLSPNQHQPIQANTKLLSISRPSHNTLKGDSSKNKIDKPATPLLFDLISFLVPHKNISLNCYIRSYHHDILLVAYGNLYPPNPHTAHLQLELGGGRSANSNRLADSNQKGKETTQDDDIMEIETLGALVTKRNQREKSGGKNTKRARSMSRGIAPISTAF